MENKKNKKKANRKPLYVLGVFLLVFIGFVMILIKPSQQNKAIQDVSISTNKEEVKEIFDKHKRDLTNKNENGETVVDEEFVMAVKKKLNSFDLSQEEILACLEWLPKSSQNLNIIIVPDLSRRIIDNVNNPEQAKYDIELLNHLWNVFEKKTKFKKNSKDKLVVDVTDNNQASGNFRKFANNLVFDLSQHNKGSNRKYFEKVQNQFQSNIENLYKLGISHPLGADYWLYFNRNLSRHIQKPNLFDNYKNVLVIITDGYLESENNLYTGNASELADLRKIIKKNPVLSEKQLDLFPKIPSSINNSFPELEVLVLEVNERTTGVGYDYDILKHTWQDWFQRLKIKNVNKNFFIQRNEATEITKREIDKFFDS